MRTRWSRGKPFYTFEMPKGLRLVGKPMTTVWLTDGAVVRIGAPVPPNLYDSIYRKT